MYKLVFIVLYVVLISIIETVGQGSIKYANSHGLPYITLIGVISYVIISLILYHLYSHENMAIINAWWNIITSITVTLSGIFIFKETLRHSEIIGIIMIIAGACFLSADDLGIVI